LSLCVLLSLRISLINKPFSETTTKDFKKVYSTNVFGVAAIINNILPFTKKGSHIVNISSVGGVQGSVKFAGLSAYSSSKGALITLTELLAEEYKNLGVSLLDSEEEIIKNRNKFRSTKDDTDNFTLDNSIQALNSNKTKQKMGVQIRNSDLDALYQFSK